MLMDFLKTDFKIVYVPANVYEDFCIRIETNETLKVELIYKSIHNSIIFYL